MMGTFGVVGEVRRRPLVVTLWESSGRPRTHSKCSRRCTYFGNKSNQSLFFKIKGAMRLPFRWSVLSANGPALEKPRLVGASPPSGELLERPPHETVARLVGAREARTARRRTAARINRAPFVSSFCFLFDALLISVNTTSY